MMVGSPFKPEDLEALKATRQEKDKQNRTVECFWEEGVTQVTIHCWTGGFLAVVIIKMLNRPWQ